jgi:F-type H+-transporting ATPase subunit delta
VKNLSIARRYAKALLLIGKDDGQAETYKEELSGVATLISGEKSLEQAICNPLYNAAERKKVLEAVIEKLNLSGVMRTFLMLLFDKGRFGFLHSISDFYRKLADELRGVIGAALTSASAMSEDTIERIRAALSQMTGKEVHLTVQQEPALIGGIVTRIGDLILDGSIRTQLLNMKESLKRGESV